MPITFNYDEKENILYETGTGLLTIKDFMDYRIAVKNAGLKQNFRSLADYSQATVDFSPGQMQLYANSFVDTTEKYGDIKIAIIISNNYSYGLARMFELLTEKDDYHVEVFTSKDEAKEWLLSE